MSTTTRPLTMKELGIPQPHPDKPTALEMAQAGENYKKEQACQALITEIMQHVGTHSFWMKEHERKGEYDKALARSKRINRLLWLYARKKGEAAMYHAMVNDDHMRYLREGYDYTYPFRFFQR
jgi:hypothetical protein